MRHRLIEGQLALPGFERPPVKYCRGGCRRRLVGQQSIERGYGPTCWRIKRGTAERRVYCGHCRRRLDDGQGGVHTVCSGCGAGMETERITTRTVIKPTRKRKRKPQEAAT